MLHSAHLHHSGSIRFAAVTIMAAGALLLSGCADAESQTSSVAGDSHYPVTVENCDTQVTFEQEPERLLLLKSAAVPALHELEVLERAVARAGAYPEDYYDQETLSELEQIEHLTKDTDQTGHTLLSTDVAIAQEPDLVLGELDNLNRQTLTPTGIPTIEEPAMCPGGLDNPSFDSIYEQLRVYGEVFNRGDRAEDVITSLQERVRSMEAKVSASGAAGRTAAVLYPTVGGGTTYAYGTQSMAHPQLEAAGFTNVFGDVDNRVFEITAEELIGRNPDVLILLHSDGDPEMVKNAVEQLPGAGHLDVLRNDDVMVQLMNFTEPATPLTVTGLENIVEKFYS